MELLSNDIQGCTMLLNALNILYKVQIQTNLNLVDGVRKKIS